MKARFKPAVLAAALAAPMVFNSFVMAPAVLAADTQDVVNINTGNFPDLSFLDCVRVYDTNKDSKLSLAEREAVTTMWIGNQFPKIESIEGLEYFPNVVQVDVSDNALETVDLSKYPQIERFYARNNQLEYINLYGCKNLKRLALQGNSDLKLVDISLNPYLLEAYEKGNFSDEGTYYKREYTSTESGLYYDKHTSLSVMGMDIGVYFPDKNLQKIVKKFDTDKNGRLKATEIGNIVWLSVYDYDQLNDVKNFTGIEYLTSLKELDIRNCSATSVDLSKLTELKVLDVSGSKLTKLDISNNKKLETLICDNTPLATLDVSECPNLLDALYNGLPVEDGKTKSYSHNGYSIKYSKDTELQYGFEIDSSHFTDAAFRKYISENLDTDKNGRMSYDEIIDVKTMDVSYLDITTLKGIDLFRELTELNCKGNKIKTLDLSKNEKLVTVNASVQTTLDQITMNKNIRMVDIHGTNIVYLKTEDYPNIKALDIYGDKFSSIDLKNLPDLERLDAGNTMIEILDVSSNPKLKALNISGSRIEEIDLKNCPEILKLLEKEPNTADGRVVYGVYVDSILTGDPAYFCYTTSKFITPSPVPTATTAPTATPVPTATTAPKATATAAPTATTAPKATATAKPTATTAPKATATAAPVVTTKPDATVTPEVTKEPSADPKTQILAFVERIYIYVLDREPEAEGAAYWTDELYGFRRTGAEVAQGFIFSEEFINRNTSDKEFVTILYKTFFGREPDEAGINYWLEQLSTGAMDRITVANGFIYSQEWADTCAAYGIRSGGELKPTGKIAPTELTYAFVERMYTTAMNRGYDEEGKQYWASELANFNITGEQVGASFFLSEEMIKYNLDDTEYVNRLYKTFMDREADADGAAYWLSVLASGTARADVVYGFTRSPEFTEKCIEARILPF